MVTFATMPQPGQGDTVITRTQCQDLCATDAKCNFYGWYEGKSRCGSCNLYESCLFRRQSACTGSDKPALYKKSNEDTARNVFGRAYDFDSNNYGMYCDGSEIMTIPEATIEQCQWFCSRLSDCWFLAYYRDGAKTQKDEDVKSDSCSIQCRLFRIFGVSTQPGNLRSRPSRPSRAFAHWGGLEGWPSQLLSSESHGPEWLAGMSGRRCGGFCPL